MNIKDQVCSLELAKKLKELGVKQESLFKWGKKTRIPYELEYFPVAPVNQDISAFTVAELGEMLPVEIRKAQSKHWYELEIEKQEKQWIIRYRNKIDSFLNIGESGDTEADCRAKMLIYLIENKLIQLGE